MIDSRAKGRSAERQVELAVQAAGLSTERALGGRNQVHGDILAGKFALEVRHREKLSIVAWSAAHEIGCPPAMTPVLVYRTNRQPWRASMLLSDFLDLAGQ